MTDPTDRDDLTPPNGETPSESGRTEISDLPSDIQALIKGLRSEAAERRRENDQLAKQMREQRDAELAEQQRWQELAEQRGAELDQLKNVQEHATTLEQTVQGVLDAQLADLPPEVQKAVQDMPGTAYQKLDWLSANRATITRAPAPNMHAGPRGDDLPLDAKLTPMEEIIMQQSGMSREAWIKNKRKREKQQQGGQNDLLERLRAMNSGE